MATPGQLVDAVAAATGIPRQTVADYDRKLAEAGLRKSVGRGRSAAKMGPEDAAALLLALLSGQGGAETVPVLKRLWTSESVPCADPHYSERFTQDWLPDPVIDPAARTLGETLTSIMATAKTGQLRERLEAGLEGESGCALVHLARSNAVVVSLFSGGINGGLGQAVQFGEGKEPGGMTEIRSIELGVFETVGAALADRTADGDG